MFAKMYSESPLLAARISFAPEDISTPSSLNPPDFIPEICGEGVHIATETKARTRDELMAQIVNNGWEGIVAADMNAAHHLNMGTNRGSIREECSLELSHQF